MKIIKKTIAALLIAFSGAASLQAVEETVNVGQFQGDWKVENNKGYNYKGSTSSGYDMIYVYYKPTPADLNVPVTVGLAGSQSSTLHPSGVWSKQVSGDYNLGISLDIFNPKRQEAVAQGTIQVEHFPSESEKGSKPRAERPKKISFLIE